MNNRRQKSWILKMMTIGSAFWCERKRELLLFCSW
jgi:hypothetical protein